VLGSTSWAANVGEFKRAYTTPEGFACRMCAAKGLPECAAPGDMRGIDRWEAYQFIAARLRRPVVIDASKSVEWCAEFLGHPEIDVRIIHLVRHPCGFVASEHRRFRHLSYAALLLRWETTNTAIEKFSAECGAPYHLVSYDDLADDPSHHMPGVCRFLGHSWESAALEYWNCDHHGFGANGASSLYLRGLPNAKFLAADDAYCDTLTSRPISADRRWKNQLPPEFCADALSHPYTLAIGARLGRPWDALTATP